MNETQVKDERRNETPPLIRIVRLIRIVHVRFQSAHAANVAQAIDLGGEK